MLSKLCISLINFYQRYLSFDTGILMVFAPGGACKYRPTCSEYAKQMIMKKGALKGIYLGVKRIISCR